MNNLNIKQLKRTRLLLMIAFIVVGFIMPGLIICDKLKLFTEFSGRKISWLAIILLVSLVYSFRNTIMEYINSLEYSVFKSIILGFSKVSFLVLILSLEVTISVVLKTAAEDTLKSILTTLDNLRYIIRWWCILSIIAHLGIRPFIDRCTHYISREARKDELREVLKE